MLPTVQFKAAPYCNDREKARRFVIAKQEPSPQAIVTVYFDLCLSTQYRQQEDSSKKALPRLPCRRHVAVFKSFDGFANKHLKIGALKLVDHQQGKILP
jgi:hypothetical protein